MIILSRNGGINSVAVLLNYFDLFESSDKVGFSTRKDQKPEDS